MVGRILLCIRYSLRLNDERIREKIAFQGEDQFGSSSFSFKTPRFGADVPFTIVDEKHFEVTVPVVMNADFYGWIFSLGGRIVIMAPEKARYSFENACRMIRRDYRWIAHWARNHETFID